MLMVPYNAQQPTNDFGLQQASVIYDTTLAASTEQNFTVPSTFPTFKAVFRFTPGVAVWVSINGTATVAGAAFATTVSEINPLCREVKAGDTISMITVTADTEVSVALYTFSNSRSV